jgi:hypothetical protein
MNKPMIRKEFLRHLAIFMLGVLGINSLISLLLQSHPQTRKLTQLSEVSKRRGFGGGRYGA